MILILQVVVSILLIVFILFQERSSGTSGLFGGTGGGAYQTRRGLEKGVYWATIIGAIIFVVLSIVNLTL